MDLLFLGDMILDAADPDHWLSGLAPVAAEADLVIAHLEVPHSRRGREVMGDVPAPAADPDHLAALARAGVHAVSLAGNHMADQGADGIEDTLAELDRLGIAHAGAGRTLAEARRPAVMDRNGCRVALLSFNCVGPEWGWAAPDRAGTAYVAVRPADGGACTPQADLAVADPASVDAMAAAISAAAGAADLVVVALHKGVTHRPAVLAPYERPLAHAAIDAGAHVVVGHHAHIARGVELHRGRPIFHGLGNGCVVTGALGPDQDHPARAAWARRRQELFGFVPDPAYPLAPFHPEAVKGLAGHVVRQPDGSIEAGFVPLWSAPPGLMGRAPWPLAEDVADYIDTIGVSAGLPSLDRRWQDGRVVLA